VKGLYRKALAGELDHFTGISDPYEEPDAPDVVVDSSIQTVDEAVAEIIGAIHSRGLIPGLVDGQPTPDARMRVRAAFA
jgi:adenylylsulfate kinase-like enzyme